MEDTEGQEPELVAAMRAAARVVSESAQAPKAAGAVGVAKRQHFEGGCRVSRLVAKAGVPWRKPVSAQCWVVLVVCSSSLAACSRERLWFGMLPGESESPTVPSTQSAVGTTSLPPPGEPALPDAGASTAIESVALPELPDITMPGSSDPAQSPPPAIAGTSPADLESSDTAPSNTRLPDASTSTTSVVQPPIELCTPTPPPTPQSRLLTNTQYDRTIRGLLGLFQVTEFAGPPSSGLSVEPSDEASDSPSAAGYKRVAEAVAKEVIASEILRANFIDCDPAGEACLQQAVGAFGRRAYRRPLTDTEIAGFQTLIDNAAELTPTGAPLEVAEMLLNTFLVSPSFLTRLELGTEVDEFGRIRLTSYEVAQRLSYALWGSTPDHELSAVADRGELTTLEQLRAQAARMVRDPRASEQSESFHEWYVGADVWPNPSKDPKSFPNFVASAQMYREELRLYVGDVVFGQQGGIRDLFQSPVAHVNDDLALLYGLHDAIGYDDTFQRTLLDTTQRPGFLTRAGFLLSNARSDRTSPSLRGAEIARRVLGLTVDEAHVDAPMDIPADSGLDTVRTRVEIATKSAECKVCHTLFDPLGFTLETYDAVGQWQTTEINGAAVNTRAEIQIDGTTVAVADSAELMTILANSQQVARAYAQSWAEFMLERKTTSFDGCYLNDAGRRLYEGGSILDVLVDIVASDAFLVRTTP